LVKKIEELEKVIARMNDKRSKEEKETLDKVKGLLEDSKWVRSGDWSAKDVEVLNSHLFLTAKPVVYLVNMSEADYKRKGNKWLAKIQEWVTKNNAGPIIPFSAEYEKIIIEKKEAEEEEKKAKGEESKGEEKKEEKKDDPPSMITKIIRTGYKALELIYFFTAGEDEVRAWTIRDGSKAP